MAVFVSIQASRCALQGPSDTWCCNTRSQSGLW